MFSAIHLSGLRSNDWNQFSSTLQPALPRLISHKQARKEEAKDTAEIRPDFSHDGGLPDSVSQKRDAYPLRSYSSLQKKDYVMRYAAIRRYFGGTVIGYCMV